MNYELKDKVDNLIANNSKRIDNCVIWTGDTDIHGTPSSYYLTDKKLTYKIYPKRLAYETKEDTIPLKKHQRLSTTCGNKNCVNRAHITLSIR